MWLILANTPPPPQQPPEIPPETMWLLTLMSIVGWLVWLAGTAFWAWMMYHCYRNESDRYLWLWIMFIIPPASLVYFIIRFLPSGSVKTPNSLKRFTKKGEIDRLATAAHQIGNAYQWIQLGDALRETGQMDRAGEAYERALQKEPENTQALWGGGCIDYHFERYASAKDRFAKVLEIDPQYKFGDVSLMQGKTLCALGELDQARSHFEEHIKRWRHPEALYVLAQLQQKSGDSDAARQTLHALLLDLDGSPRAIARRHGQWRGKARKLLKQLSP